MLTRIQLNLLGRRSYLSSVVSLATGSAQAAISLENNDDGGPEPTSTYRSDFEINQKYLTFSWWLLNRGWVDMMQRVESAVRHVFGHLSPRDTITLEHFARLTSDVRTMLEGSGARTGNGTKWLPLVLPTPDMEDFVLRESGILDNNARPLTTEPSTSPLGSSTSLRRLLDETADLVESPAFSTVLTQLLDAGFRVLIDKKLQAGAFAVTSPPGPAGPTTLDPQVDRAVLLPRVLSVLTRQAHAIGIGVPNEYLQEMETVRDLEGFAAVVYSSNWEAEITQDGDGIMTSAAHVGGRSAPSVQPSHLLDLDAVGESMIVVDPARSGLESAWEQATAAQQGFRR